LYGKGLDFVVRIDADRKLVDALGDLLDSYIKFIIEKEPKSLRFIEEVEKLERKL
jgi:hypothetical protein